MKIPDHRLSRRRFMELAGAAAIVPFASLPVTGWAASPNRVRIGIVGSGNVGSALGRTWAQQAGHQVMFSSRNVEDDRKLAAGIGANASAGTPREAVAFGEVVLLAVPYGALPALSKDLAEALRGKIVIDACNPFPERDGEIAVQARAKGAGLATAELFPGARLVRAFNAIGAERMGLAYKEPQRIGMPLAGDDAQAVEVATRLIRDIGYEPVLVGGLERGRFLMPGTPLAGERPAAEVRRIAMGL